MRIRMLDAQGTEQVFCDASAEDDETPLADDLARARDQTFEEEVFAEVMRPPLDVTAAYD